MTVRYVQAPTVADVLHADGEALVLVGESLLRLGILAASALDFCSEPRTVAEVVAPCETALGPAPDGAAAAAVGTALDQLADNGILIRLG